MNKRFLVLCRPTGGVRTFETAQDVALYMWGRDVRIYDIYLLASAENPNDVDDLREKLKACEDKLYV